MERNGYIKAPTLLHKLTVTRNEIHFITGSKGNQWPYQNTQKLKFTQRVIPIPGNQEGVNRIIDLLYRKGEVIVKQPIYFSWCSTRLMLMSYKTKLYSCSLNMVKKHKELAVI